MCFLLVKMRLGFATLDLFGRIVAVVLMVSSESDVCEAQFPVVKVTSWPSIVLIISSSAKIS